MKSSLGLIAAIVCCKAAFLFAGTKDDVGVYLLTGLSGLVGSSVLFLAMFRTLFERRSWRTLQFAMILIALHAILLCGDAALRLADYTRRRATVTERHAYILNAYLPFFQSDGYRKIWRKHPVHGHDLVPGAVTQFLDCPVAINSDGFRGPEIKMKAPDELRVMCVGASTTFGWTVNASDKPYPEVLEALLSESSDRPVTVINAGVAGLRVEQNALRMPRLLSFDPDVMVVYQGFANIPSGISGDFRMRPRASLLLQLAILRFARWTSEESEYPKDDRNKFRDGLEEIAAACDARNVRLFLCTFALAYDLNTPASELAFFDALMPQGTKKTGAAAAFEFIEINNRIVREVAASHGCPVVDIDAALGGRYELFLDFAHFDQQGRDILGGEIAKAIAAEFAVTKL